MAARRTVDLGTVGFGLVADTKALEASMRTLRAFGRQVNDLANQGGWADPMFKKFASIESILTRLQVRVQQTTQRMREAGLAAAEIDKVEQAYRRLQNTMTKGAGGLGPQEIRRGIAGMNSILSAANAEAAAAATSKLATTFRDLERAAILAVGPLSGIGARMAVLSALFDSTSAKMALFIAGTVGAVTGISMLAVAGVKATMDMQKFDAQLTASTGASGLNAKAYEYVASVADRLGVNVRALVEPYAKFTTAARLSNVPLEQQRHIFEAATIAGRAMMLNGERMSLVFLALEQMFSKGTVSMEELRRQLGDLLPGSFELAAKAMGMTNSQFIKAIENGEIMARDLLPKLAKMWKDVFGPAAEKSSKTLLAELERLRSSTFELLKKFDEATGFSETFRRVVIATKEAMDSLRVNMDSLIATFGLFAGAGAGYLAYSLFLKMIPAVGALATGFLALRTATLSWAAAIAALESSTIIGFLARIALMATGAAVGWRMLSAGAEDASKKYKDWNEQTLEWIKLQERMGEAHKGTTEQIKAENAERLSMAKLELGVAEALLNAQLAYARANLPTIVRRRKVSNRSLGDTIIEKGKPEDDPEVKAAQEKVDALTQAVSRLESIRDRLANLKVAPDKPEVKEAGDAWKHWLDRIKKDLREVESLKEQISAGAVSKEQMDWLQALKKAEDTMASQPEKKRGAIEALRKSLADAGFAGANLTEQLAKMYLMIEQRKESVKYLEELPRKMSEGWANISEMFAELEARTKGALEADPEKVKQNEQLEKNVQRLVGFLKDMRLEQEQINYLTAAYRREWKEMTDVEAQQERIKKVTHALAQLEDHIGDSQEKAAFDRIKNLKLIKEAQELNIITAEKAAKLADTVEADTYRKALDRATLFGRDLRSLFHGLERGLLDAFYDITHGVEGGWKRLFLSLERTVFDFVAKVMVIEPIMKLLFGGAYTRRNEDKGTGIFEGALMSLSNFGRGSGVVEGEWDWMRRIGSWFRGGDPLSGFSPSLAATPTAQLIDPSWLEAGAGLFGFASGGSFKVGGGGGEDSSLVAFMATPGEEVEVRRPGQSRSGITIVQHNHFTLGIRTEVRSEIAQQLPKITEAARQAVVDAQKRGANE
jgi:tape measure domain-containing protein